MLWIFLILIFIRPFVSSLAFPQANYLLSSLLLIFLAARLSLRRPCVRNHIPILYPFLSFFLAIFISFVFSQNRLVSIAETYKYLLGLLLFLYGLSLTKVDKDKIVWGLALSGLFVSGLAIYQYLFGFKHIADYLSRQNISDPFLLDAITRKRVFSPFVTSSVLGGYLAMIIPLALSRKRKFLIIAPLTLALLLTKSVSASLSIFAGVLLYFFLEGRLNRNKILSIGGLWVLLLSVVMMRAATSKEHLQPLFSTLMRLNYWTDTLKVIWSFPWTGLGLGNFNLAYSRYAHNSYLQLWAEMGILGIASFLWLIFQIFKSALSNLRDNPGKIQTISLITAAAVFLFHNLFEFTFFLPEVSILWWLILGLMISRLDPK